MATNFSANETKILMPALRSLPDGSADPVSRRRVRQHQLGPGSEQFLAQAAAAVFAFVDAAALQFRDNELDEILEAFRRYRIGEVETVDAGCLDPGDHRVGDLLRRAD